ncbi:hypothetical protein I8H89_02935 [Candidatus Saccharibacteria bacterium]|nr:hypothetical protein [Candidatus Saccharibacteria bacterium]
MFKKLKTFTKTTIVFSAVTILIAACGGVLSQYAIRVVESGDGNMGMLVWVVLVWAIAVFLIFAFLLGVIFNLAVVYTEPNKIYSAISAVLSLVFISAILLLLTWVL